MTAFQRFADAESTALKPANIPTETSWEGRNIEAGAADFLRCYGSNLSDPPAGWNHVVASFDRWLAKPNRGDLVQIRKGPQSQRETTPQPPRYPLARLADPFETELLLFNLFVHLNGGTAREKCYPGTL
jgi:hypothetical protein